MAHRKKQRTSALAHEAANAGSSHALVSLAGIRQKIRPAPLVLRSGLTPDGGTRTSTPDAATWRIVPVHGVLCQVPWPGCLCGVGNAVRAEAVR